MSPLASHPIELTLMGTSWLMEQSIVDEMVAAGAEREAMAQFLQQRFRRGDTRLLLRPSIEWSMERN